MKESGALLAFQRAGEFTFSSGCPDCVARESAIGEGEGSEINNSVATISWFLVHWKETRLPRLGAQFLSCILGFLAPIPRDVSLSHRGLSSPLPAIPTG